MVKVLAEPRASATRIMRKVRRPTARQASSVTQGRAGSTRQHEAGPRQHEAGQAGPSQGRVRAESGPSQGGKVVQG